MSEVKNLRSDPMYLNVVLFAINSYPVNPNAYMLFYTKLGTYKGYEQDSSAWDYLGYVAEIYAGPSYLTVSFPDQLIPPGQTRSLYVIRETGRTVYMSPETGPVGDANMEYLSSTASTYLFGTSYTGYAPWGNFRYRYQKEVPTSYVCASSTSQVGGVNVVFSGSCAGEYQNRYGYDYQKLGLTSNAAETCTVTFPTSFLGNLLYVDFADVDSNEQISVLESSSLVTLQSSDIESSCQSGVFSVSGSTLSATGSGRTVALYPSQSPACSKTVGVSVNVAGSAGDGVGFRVCFATANLDYVAPALTCPGDVTALSPSNSCGTSVSYTIPTATDQCGIQTQYASASSGSFFPVGPTTVTATAVDNTGFYTTCDFVVDVKDVTNPVITCPASITLNLPAGQCEQVVTFSTPSVSDNCGSVSSVVSNPSSGSTFFAGVTTVTSTAIDSSGNSASCTFTVTMQDPSGHCLCGNGRIDPGEQCEVNQLGSATCQSQQFPLGGVLECGANCQYDTSRCAVCGDGRIDGSEQCDGSNLNGLACQSNPLYTSGQLKCTVGSCQLDYSSCSRCGDGIISSPFEQCDGSNLNGKTCVGVLGSGVTTGGTLACSSQCQFDTSQCVTPKVTKPDGSTVLSQALGIAVTASGFLGDTKVTVIITDGTNSKTYTGVSLSIPSGTLQATFQVPSPLGPSNKWRVTVRGETTRIEAKSVLFTVKSV